MKNFTQALEELKNGNRVRRSGARWFVQMVDKRLCTYGGCAGWRIAGLT
jgi:hypothetical protein